MKVPFLALGFLLGSFLILPAPPVEEIAIPDDYDARSFIKGKLPEFCVLKCATTKAQKVKGADGVLSCVITVSLTESLYVDVTREAVPELAGNPRLPASVPIPVIIKRNHGDGEIVEMPVEIQLKLQNKFWKAMDLADNGLFEALGKPLSQQKLGAALYGSAEAKQAILAFRREMSKVPTTRKKSSGS